MELTAMIETNTVAACANVLRRADAKIEALLAAALADTDASAGASIVDDTAAILLDARERVQLLIDMACSKKASSRFLASMSDSYVGRR